MVSACGLILFGRLKVSLPFAGLCSRFSTHRSSSDTSGALLHVIGTGSNEVTPTLCLVSGKHRYWFNTGEGTSRTLSGFKFGLGHSPVVLFTQRSWDNIAGFSSLFARYVKSTIFDGTMSFIGPTNSSEAIRKVLANVCGKNSLREMQEVDDEVINISRIDLRSDLAAYYCKQRGRSGSLDVEKAVSLGVPVGQALRSLKDGKDYKTSSGRIVKSQEVVGPEKKGASFVVLQCPDQSCIDSVCSNWQLQPAELNQRLDFIVHIAPFEVIDNEMYCMWMSRFGSNVRHIFLHSSVCPAEVTWRDSFGLSLPYHMMNPEVFPVPFVPKKNNISWSGSNVRKHLNEDQIVVGCSRLMIRMTIGEGSEVDASKVWMPLEEFVDDAYNKVMKFCQTNIESYHQSFPEIAARSTKYLKNSNSLNLLSSSDAIVTFLGTGGGDNTVYRNESSILIQCGSGRNIMLDCGESTLLQLKRCFGLEKALEVLSKIQIIFISHMHPDHWTGLFELLRQRRRTCNAPPITVIGPSAMNYLIASYCSFFPDIDCDLINAGEFVKYPYKNNNWSIKTIPVHHIVNSFGVKVSSGDQWSVVYSGDTRPCPGVIEAAKDVSLLIHEGTFSGDRSSVNVALNRHCLYSEAVKAGKLSSAEFTAITHFSSAETLFPLTEPSVASVFPAMDFMCLKLSDIAKQHLDSQEVSRVNQSICVYSKSLRYDDCMEDDVFDSSDLALSQ